MKIAIITDSNSGITQQQGEELGVFVIPMPFMINGTTYFEDIDLSQKEFYERLSDGDDVSTSQPAPGMVLDVWNEVLKTYDGILHIPMASSLSSTCETAVMLAADFDGKVQVVDNLRISITMRQTVLDAKKMVENGMGLVEIKEALEATKLDFSIYITVDTLKYLKKGGRITPAVALLGSLLKIKPVLTIQGGKLDAFAKARTMKQAKSMMVSAIQKDIRERFQDVPLSDLEVAVAHTNHLEAAMEFKKELEEIFGKSCIFVDHLSLSVSCHVGPGALAVGVYKPYYGG